MALVRYISALGLVIMLLYKMNNRRSKLVLVTPLKRYQYGSFRPTSCAALGMRVGSLLNWFHISVTCPKSFK